MYFIRNANLNDIPQLAIIEQECFSSPMSAGQLEKYIDGDGRRIIVAADGAGNIFGYAGLLYVLDEGDILNIAVKEDCRRTGVGKALLSALTEIAVKLQLSFITLEVRESNTAAIMLYEKNGFERVGLRKNYYVKPTENALLLTKYLK